MMNNETIKFEVPFTKEEAVVYIQTTLRDGTIKPIHITWGFDEQQADPFHHFWTGKDFLSAIRVLVGE